jgi:hypothetical protein
MCLLKAYILLALILLLTSIVRLRRYFMALEKGIFRMLTIIFGIMLVISFFGCDLSGDDETNGTDSSSGSAGGGGGSSSASGHVTQELARIQRTAESHSTHTIDVSRDESIAPHVLQYTGAINVTVILRGIGGNRTLRLSSNGTMFTVRSNVTLILDDNITLQGHSQNTGAMVNIDGGRLIMNAGSAITGNNGNGVAFTSWGGGTIFEMNGGIISNNSGRGVDGFSIGTFTMNDGTISGNNGGGVYISDATFTMHGGTIIGNTASSGGGVYIFSGAALGFFNMHGGIITGNTARENGGGVYGWRFVKNGGTITGHSSDPINGNVVRDSGGNVLARRGHAVFAADSGRRKETTAGPNDNLDISSTVGWDE